jgi:iron complex transport system substrate-binding protein
MRSWRVLRVAAVTAVMFAVAACGGSTELLADEPDGSADAFPLTIKHAFGETTIESKPQRIAAVAWANHEVPLALGIVPVGFARADWGDDDNDGVLPWVEDRLEQLNAPTPVLFDETDGIDFETVADTQPDVILAAYSGLTQEDYDTLSQIAPVVAYPDLAWGTSMEDMIRINSRAIGLAAEGEKLVSDLDSQISASFAKYPVLAGKSALFTWMDPTDFSQVGFYTTHDPRAGFLAAVGMTTPRVVADKSAASESFFESISAEQVDLLSDVDIIVTYDDAAGAGTAAAKADPLLGKVPAIANGAVAQLQDGTPLAASANPSPLSVGWGVDRYFALLAQAAAKAA